MSPSKQEILHAYRHLYQHALRAVQYSTPARYNVRNHLRAAFRSSPIESFDSKKIATTLQFLHGAAKYKGLEHKIVKGLMHVWWDRHRPSIKPHPGKSIRLPTEALRRSAYANFDRTLEKLNETMGMCIK
ncbi:Hypothetical predicted protein [Lecanosticta acicola]|uniref:DUF1763-domain-containing protein n=1 Tax=Lecanosticta acicola TaxID=111012 RepID=A0AAI8YUQ5_9PEZI|nr:Hypothetical predicted protein [Lecanosticta acicola]